MGYKGQIFKMCSNKMYSNYQIYNCFYNRRMDWYLIFSNWYIYKVHIKYLSQNGKTSITVKRRNLQLSELQLYSQNLSRFK